MTARIPVSVVNLGRMAYMDAYRIQQHYVNKHFKVMDETTKFKSTDENTTKGLSTGEDTILLVEHHPVYTIGLRQGEYPKEVEQELIKKGAEFHRTDRGGLITFHGPGQLVAYPILNLRNFKIGMRAYIQSLERAVIRSCGSFGISAKTSPCTGVWVGDSKICAMGVHGSRFVTSHGLALNCNTDLTWFGNIVPCGIPDKDVTSLSKVTGKNVTIGMAKKPLLDSFQEEFNCEISDGVLDVSYDI